jgi:hypothetical protein
VAVHEAGADPTAATEVALIEADEDACGNAEAELVETIAANVEKAGLAELVVSKKTTEDELTTDTDELILQAERVAFKKIPDEEAVVVAGFAEV